MLDALARLARRRRLAVPILALIAGLDTREAVAAGLERTGRIITAAALLGDWNWWAPRPLRLLQHRLAPGTEPP